MPILSTDIVEYKSLNANSDGGAIDTSRPITSAVLDNLWFDITGAQALAGGSDFRKVFRKNTNGALTWGSVLSFILTQPAQAKTWLGIGINDANDNDATQGNMTAWTLADNVTLLSDGADVRVATIYGELAGVYQTEMVTLTGTTPVISVNTYDHVYAVWLASTSGSRTVTVKQTSSGAVRGTIGPNKIICWIWRTAADMGSGLAGFCYQHGNIAPAGLFGLWLMRSWSPGATTVSGTYDTIRSQGNTPP